MQDAPIETVISKVDMADTAKELPGATLQILKKVTAEDGTTSEEIAATVYGEKLQWISGEEARACPQEITSSVRSQHRPATPLQKM